MKNVLDEIEALLKELVILKSEYHYQALTLWIAHCHAISDFDFTPRLGIWSPEKRCGKSLLLEVISYFIPKSRMTSSISVSALFRLIDRDENKVFLIDEADATFGRNGDKEKAEALRQIINSGFKRGQLVTRCDGNSFEPKDFSIFCPVALAGIGTDSIPETIADRSILIEMRRKYPNESIREFQSDEVEEVFGYLAQRLADEMESRKGKLRPLRPELPKELHSRAKDVWKPLFKIASTFGNEWEEKAWKACLALSEGEAEPEDASLQLRLLSECRLIFDSEKMTSADLVLSLQKLEEAPWQRIPLTTHLLATLLKNYKIKPLQFSGGKVRGYYRAHFEESWERYLPPLEAVATVAIVAPQEFEW